MDSSNIKIDLHIHSKASAYKEAGKLVDRSDIEHLDILMTRLNENEVAMFSITDHNRFDAKLYEAIDRVVASGRYANVKQLLAGVEFDVRFEEDMSKCHVITIFDARNSDENYKKIADVIERDKLEKPDDCYSRDMFERLLHDIGLNVVLIACQRSGVDAKSTTHHNSLSDSIKDPRFLLKVGYIEALEFQRPNVEGILKENLKTLPSNISLVMGSDCHEWGSYPYHDAKNQNISFSHTRIKALPTFKGLVMAVTSPKNRINRQKNTNPDFIKNLHIGTVDIPLANGINVIIGENGSGKSTILNLLANKSPEGHEKRLININNITSSMDVSANECYLVQQGEIVKKFSDNTLFPDDNYLALDNIDFTHAYTNFAKNLYKSIGDNIKAKQSLDELADMSFRYDLISQTNNHFISVIIDDDFGKIKNRHNNHLQKIVSLINSIEELKQDGYYSEYKENLDTIGKQLQKIRQKINVKNNKKESEIRVKTIITSAHRDYEQEVRNAATSIENQLTDYNNERDSFIRKIVHAAKNNSEQCVFPSLPQPVDGKSSNPINGFYFNCEAKYNAKDVSDEFFKKMFNKDFENMESLSKIDSMDKLAIAIRGCSSSRDIQEKWKTNLNAFLEDMYLQHRYIKDGNNEGLGNTLGEMSLAFFNYQTRNNDRTKVFLLDQPEDHISNSNIAKRLIDYLDSIRHKSQLIIVTHNPLLVVNQDADKVIFLEKDGDKITTFSGCLEYESEEGSVLDIIADNMDGGRQSIERRLKVYGKKY